MILWRAQTFFELFIGILDSVDNNIRYTQLVFIINVRKYAYLYYTNLQ